MNVDKNSIDRILSLDDSELRRLASEIASAAGADRLKTGIMLNNLDRLRAIIAAEDKAHPLSDERISEMLKGAGFHVARRTVAKYRGLAGIPGASERRQ